MGQTHVTPCYGGDNCLGASQGFERSPHFVLACLVDDSIGLKVEVSAVELHQLERSAKVRSEAVVHLVHEDELVNGVSEFSGS